MTRRTGSILILMASAAAARAAPEQLTASAGDSAVERFGPPGSGLVAIQSSGDLLPGAPGNADGSREVFLFQLGTRSLRQVTASAGDSGTVRITPGGALIVASRADLTPGVPGNADGSFEAWLDSPATALGPGSFVQLTSSVEDSFFQTFWDDGRRAFFVSKGDLTPGAPGNADGQNEVYAYDVAAKTLTQLTNSPRQSLIRAICAPERCGVIESSADLVPGTPGNADGSSEVFLLDLDTLAIEQVTASAGDAHYRGQDAAGRRLAFEATGDLAPGAAPLGNADGSQEVFVHDRIAKTLVQVTSSAGTSYFDGFVPRSTLVVVDSTQDLVPGLNADASFELFTVDTRSGRTVQQTSSGGDAFFAGFANARNGLAAIISGADLDGGGGAVPGVTRVFLQKLGKKAKRARRVTDGDRDADPAGFDRKGRYVAIQSRGDLVAGQNADHGAEVFVARTKGRPKLRQVTASAADSVFEGFTDDGRAVIVTSRGDLVAIGTGNADGSQEVFRIEYR